MKTPSPLRERLLTPFALVGQGFVAGGILFFATHEVPLGATPPAAPVLASAPTTL
jgi:hypothetical protein